VTVAALAHPRPSEVPGAALPVVLYTLGALDIGGTEMRSLELFAELRARHPRLAIHLYIQSQRRGALDERFAALGIRLIRGHTGWRALAHFWRTCRRLRPDIVHTCIGTTNGFMLLAAWAAGVRTRICHVSSTTDGRTSLSGRLKAAVGRGLARRFSTQLAGVSDACRNALGEAPANWRTIYRGIKFSPAASVPERAPAPRCCRVLYLGRISPQKNYLRPIAILEALYRLAPDADVALEYVGPGSRHDLARLAEAAAGSSVAARIRLSGPTARALDVLSGADLLLLTSLWEGLPGVAIEALSVGTPVVANDLPGVREIAERVEGVTRLPLTAPDRAWAEAVLRALAAPDRARIRASFGRSPFLMEHYVAGFESLWRLPGVVAGPARQAERSRLSLGG